MSSSFNTQQFARKPQAQSPFDWLTFPGVDIVEAPHPDLFESELDVSLSTYDHAQLDQLSLDFHPSADPFAFRSDTPGPLSTFTVSSESAYGGSLSSRSESLYAAFPAPSSPSAYPSIDDFGGIDFSSFSVADLATMAPSPPKTLDFDLDVLTSGAADTSSFFHPAPSSTSSASLSPPPRATEHHRPASSDDAEPRKKYNCNHCSRSFARAFNLKTHMATHDPNRPKPHICTACNRSFSRKHDLGRHMISIHKDHNTPTTPTVGSFSPVPPTPSAQHPSLSRGPGHMSGPIGAGRASARGWCNNCGKGWVGKAKDCNCETYK